MEDEGCYRNFWMRHEQTDTSNWHWSEQTEDLMDAFMRWSLRQKNGDAPPVRDREIWVEVIDIFGEAHLRL